MMRLGLAASAMMVLAACASGNRAGGPRGPMIEDGVPPAECLLKPMATNGTLARDAMERHARAQFDAADADRSGVLSRAETATLNAARATSCDRSPVIDWGAEGIGFDEFASRYRTAFERADANADGVLAGEEFKSGPRLPPPERRERREGDYRGPETP